MSETEIAGTQSNTHDNVAEGTQYAYYVTNSTDEARIKQMSSSNNDYWLRSAYSGNDSFSDFAIVRYNGSISTAPSGESYAIPDANGDGMFRSVAVCFCI